MKEMCSTEIERVERENDTLVNVIKGEIESKY